MLDTVQATIYEQPHKTPLIAGAIQISNSINSSIGKITIESFHNRLQEAINEGNFGLVKAITRLICCLFPIIEGDGDDNGAFKLLNCQLDRAIELQQSLGSKRSPLAEDLFISVALSLPFIPSTVILTHISDDTKESITKLIVKLREFYELHRKVENEYSLDIISPFTGDKQPYSATTFISHINSAIDQFEAGNFETRTLIDLPRLIELGLPEGSPPIKHPFPAVNFPEIDNLPEYKDEMYLTPRLFFSVYLPEKFSVVPPPGTYESLLFRDISCDIINHMDFNRNEVTRQLCTLDLFFAKTAFAEPTISMEELERLYESSPSTSTWKVENVAFEAILEELMRLPKNLFHPAYFHSIIIEACRVAPRIVAPAVGRAIRFLYNNIESLDFELQQRTLDWFSHHLSNYGFSWKWGEWTEGISLPEMHPKRVFIQQLILKELRLSTPDRILPTLPPEYAQFVPSFSKNPECKWFSPELQFQEEAEKFLSLMSSEKSEIEELLKEIREKANEIAADRGSESFDPTSTLVDLVVTVTCFASNRSLSHAELSVNQIKEILIDVCSLDPTTAIESIFDYWSGQPHVALLVTTVFIKYGVISPKSFIQTIFDYTKSEEEKSVLLLKAKQDGITDIDYKAASTKGIWPHWELLTTTHGWEMMLRLIEVSFSEESPLASSERDELLIEILTQLQQLIYQIESDVSDMEGIAKKSRDEAIERAAEAKMNEGGDEVVEEGDEENNEEIRKSMADEVPKTKEEIDWENKKWALWWVQGFSKSLIRHYSEYFKTSEVVQSLPKSITDNEKSYVGKILEQINF